MYFFVYRKEIAADGQSRWTPVTYSSGADQYASPLPYNKLWFRQPIQERSPLLISIDQAMKSDDQQEMQSRRFQKIFAAFVIPLSVKEGDGRDEIIGALVIYTRMPAISTLLKYEQIQGLCLESRETLSTLLSYPYMTVRDR